jgi:succinate-acetate transporter protein
VVVGFLILPILFGPLALIFGIVAVSQRQRAGWIGIILGGIAVYVVASALNELSDILDEFGQ